MKKRARWLLAVMLTVAVTLSCMPVASAAGSKATKVGQNANPWGLNVDLSGVPGQVQAAVANMIARGEEPMEKETDAFLAEVVEDASGISFEAVKTSLGLELLQNTMGTMGTMDTSRFNLGEEEFNRVMKEVLSEYFLTDVAYECDVEDGIVTGIWFMPAFEAPSLRDMFTAQDLWSMYPAPLTAATLSASRLENDPAPDVAVLSEDGETKEITVQVKWVNDDASTRPESVTVRLDDDDSDNYYNYSFKTVEDGQATIVVSADATYTISEVGVVDGKLIGKNDATYSVEYGHTGDIYTVTNTLDVKTGPEYKAEFVPVRNDKYVEAEDGERSIDLSEYGIPYPVAVTLVYDPSNPDQKIGPGPKTMVDFDLDHVELTSIEDGEVITIPADQVNTETRYIMYDANGVTEFGSYDILVAGILGSQGIDPSRATQDQWKAAKATAALADCVKYYWVEYEGVTYGGKPGALDENGICTEINFGAEGCLNVDDLSMPIHWNAMLAFTHDYAKHFGVAGDFWTSKNTDQTPYGAFKTQLDSYPEDYMPNGVMDYYMENMTLAYMADEMNYGELLDMRIDDCVQQLDDRMTPVQKYLVIHDWLANNAQFDMGVLAAMMSGDSNANPTPSQMTAFGALLSSAIPKDPQNPEYGNIPGCICLGYSAAYALLIQHAFPEIYQNSDDTWKTPAEVGDDDIVDLVQIRFYADLVETSVAGANSGMQEGMFASVHYYNAVKVGSEWYCVDSAYDDINTEVMDQCRVETYGNISHKYFMISPVNMLDMFKNSMDYIDCLYDGVVFERVPKEDGSGWETEEDKYGEDHVIWERHDVDESVEHKSDDDQYEATWFSGAVGEITYDDDYWYYVTGPSFSYASMLALMNKIQGSGNGGSNMGDMGNMDNPFNSDKPSDKDRLVRRPRTAADEPVESESSSGSGMGMGMESYDDPYDQTLFHFGYGSVVPGENLDDENEEANRGEYYGEVVIDETYYDMYPDLVHSMGMYDGVLYFNLGNKIYTMTGADKQGDLTAEDLTVAQLKEYNDVYAKTDGRDFTGMSFYAVSKADYEKGAKDNAFHVFNRPIAAISIEDQVKYTNQPIPGPDGSVVGMKTVRDGDPVTTLTVNIATNFSESYKTKDGAKYQLEAVDYNPNYSKYTDDKDDPATNDNEEFMWCANVVDTMPMKDMLSDKDSGKTESVTVDAWCDQDGYTEQRTVGYGLSDGTGKTVNKSDLALNHHYIENEREECYICAHCNDSYHDEYTKDDDGYKPKDENATYGHYEDSKPTFVDIVWGKNYATCTAKIQCSEPHCDHVMREIKCDEITESTIKGADGVDYLVITASYDGNVVDRQYPEGEPSVVLGDVNGDGKINSGDLLRLHKYLLDDSTEISDLATDVNGDGKVNSGDLLRLRKYLLDPNNVALG